MGGWARGCCPRETWCHSPVRCGALLHHRHPNRATDPPGRLIYYIILGDNGASAEGTLNGVGRLETTEFMRAHIDEFGSPSAYNHYAVGWAHAMRTPYQWTKHTVSSDNRSKA